MLLERAEESKFRRAGFTSRVIELEISTPLKYLEAN
jgi:hypothetical protein